ncbi:MAG: ABC transporter ATP-binding protein [Chloroflexi bacterium]|nr:ABC transporter ATP-binding protein [Chloroflexota bacterium]
MILLFGPYRWHVLALAVMVTGSAALSLFPLRLLGTMADKVIDGDLGSLDLLFGIYVAMVVSGALLGVLQGYVNQIVGQGVMLRLRSRLHDHLQRLPMRFYTRTRTGEILSRVTSDVNGIQRTLTDTFTDFMTNASILTIAFVLMFTLSWQLALIALVVVPLWSYPTMRMGLLQRRLLQRWHVESANMAAHLEETLSVSGSMLVKSFGRQPYERDRFEETNANLRSLSLRRMMAARWFNMGSSLFSTLIPGIVYWYGGRAVVDGDISIGTLVAFALLTQRVFGPFASIARINVTMLSSLALFERIFEYLDEDVEIEERADAVALKPARGSIAFEGVDFAYDAGARWAVSDLSFRAEPGQMTALVGPSGAGKTTITYLLQRFYDPQGGVVRLDGHDLRELTLDSVSTAVGAVMQDAYLFHDTLAENIRYGRLAASDAEVAEVAETAGLSSFIAQLPEGIQTVVGERGYRLSGGEKQRVAIARAILKDARVLVLDEATASLDSKLEREIREATRRLARGRTTLVIAHRLSTVLAADQILVLDGGQIVERGRHAELLARRGLYASLYEEQFAEEAGGLMDPAAGGS